MMSARSVRSALINSSRFSSSYTATVAAKTGSLLTFFVDSVKSKMYSEITYQLCEGVDVRVKNHPVLEKTGLRRLFSSSEECCDRFTGFSFRETEFEYNHHQRRYKKNNPTTTTARDTTSKNSGVLAGLGGFVVKEIAIPAGLSNGDGDQVCLHTVLLQSMGARAYGRGQIPGLYVLPTRSGDVTLRLVPLSRMLITLQVQDIAAAKDALKSCGLQVEEVGGKKRYAEGEKSTTELHILSNVFDDPINQRGSESEGRAQDISVRICEHDTVRTFFNEASFSVTEGTIKAIQSDRVYGGPPTLVESKYGYAGDCWVEFWHMAREKTKEVVSSMSSSPSVRSDKSPRPSGQSKVSRAPSIVE